MTPSKLTLEQRLSIIEYASQPEGCKNVLCGDCHATARDKLGCRCIMSSSQQTICANGSNSQKIAKQYIQQHPELFTVEDVTEALL